MEEEGIGLVLARAIELRLKISNSIHKPHQNGIEDGGEKETLASYSTVLTNETEEEVEVEEMERLLGICDALESLETQLSSLQTLQQQQQYERELALSEIENSRKMLLGKLKEYKGEDLEVIHEASAFAGETVEHNSDLQLPPYASRPPRSTCLDNGSLSQFPSTRKSIRNGVLNSDQTNEVKKNVSESERSQKQTRSRKGWGFFISAAAKMVLTLVGVVSILSFSGHGPNLPKRGTLSKEKRSNTQCPPGKVLVVEDGEARCLVKERVEVPFSSVVAKPDVNYGCG